MELKVIGDNSEKKDSKEDLIRIVNAWKMLKGLPMEGQPSKNWNTVHFPRHLSVAKKLLLLFDNWENAVDCVQFVYEKLDGIGCTFTFETILKHSDSYREKLAGKGK